jgi:hypothetical protein
MFALVVGTSSVSQEMFLVDELFGCSAEQGCRFPRKKLFQGTWNKRKLGFIPMEIRMFHEMENNRNSFPSHSAEDKNARNPFRTNPWKIKTLGTFKFRSKPFP